MNLGFKIEKLYARINRTYKIIGLVLIIIGIAGATFPFWGAGILPETNPLEKLGRSEIETPALAANLSIADQTAQNRLIIESAGVDMPLFLSSNEKALLKGGWVYSGNSTPDAGGNTVIFGHRWRYKPPVKNTFFNLDKVTVGGRFTINWNGKAYNYEVSGIKIIKPTEVSVLNPTASPQVTLITCAPLFSTKQRLVVVAKPVE